MQTCMPRRSWFERARSYRARSAGTRTALSRALGRVRRSLLDHRFDVPPAGMEGARDLERLGLRAGDGAEEVRALGTRLAEVDHVGVPYSHRAEYIRSPFTRRSPGPSAARARAATTRGPAPGRSAGAEEGLRGAAPASSGALRRETEAAPLPFSGRGRG